MDYQANDQQVKRMVSSHAYLHSRQRRDRKVHALGRNNGMAA
jgi:hypothetical protein